MASDDLRGRGILVTRPRAQAAPLARLIEQAGGRALLFPAIEIEDVPAPGALSRLHEFDLVIFVSPTAVAKAMPQVRAWPAGPRVAAVGAGTRRALEKHGIANVIAPATGADSEALLATPELGDVAGKRIAILRGDGGRALLGDTFVERSISGSSTANRFSRPWLDETVTAASSPAFQGRAGGFGGSRR